MKKINKRHCGFAGHPWMTVIVAFFLYYIAAIFLNKYWKVILYKIGFSDIYGYKASAIKMILLFLTVLMVMKITGTISVSIQNRIAFLKAILPGIYIFCFSIMSVLYNLEGSIEFRDNETILFSIIYYIAVALTEELIFRGIIFGQLVHVFNGEIKKQYLFPAVISSVVFASLHATNLQHAEISGVLIQITGAFVMGILFTAIYYRTANIYAVIFLHAVNNLAATFPVTVLKSNEYTTDIVSKYRLSNLIFLLPVIVILPFILRKSKHIEISELWNSNEKGN